MTLALAALVALSLGACGQAERPPDSGGKVGYFAAQAAKAEGATAADKRAIVDQALRHLADAPADAGLSSDEIDGLSALYAVAGDVALDAEGAARCVAVGRHLLRALPARRQGSVLRTQLSWAVAAGDQDEAVAAAKAVLEHAASDPVHDVSGAVELVEAASRTAATSGALPIAAAVADVALDAARASNLTDAVERLEAWRATLD